MIGLANDTEYGLASGIWTPHIDPAKQQDELTSLVERVRANLSRRICQKEKETA